MPALVFVGDANTKQQELKLEKNNSACKQAEDQLNESAKEPSTESDEKEFHDPVEKPGHTINGHHKGTIIIL